MDRPDLHETRAHWDRMAEGYDSAKRRNDVYYSTLKACFDEAVPQAARGRVLEVGCGTGQVLASLRPLNGVGIDLSENMIDIAKREFAHRGELTFAVMDAGKAAGGGAAGAGGLGEFDAVISADVLEHVEDWRSVLAMMVRLCRSGGGGGGGGVIAVSTPNPMWALPLWVLEKMNLKMPEGPHAYVSARAIARALTEMGCEVLSRRTHLIVPMKLWGVGRRASAVASATPGLSSMGVIQMVVGRKT